MPFTHPAALWLLALLALPLIITRIRPPARRREVGNLYLWQRLAARDGSSVAPRRTRAWMLALVQALCIGSLTIALADPLITPGASHVAFVVDVSPTMGTRNGSVTRLDIARDRARGIVRTLPANTRVAMITAARTPQRLRDTTASGAALDQWLAALAPAAAPANLATALQVADTAGVRLPDVFVFTDRMPAEQPESIERAVPPDHWIRVSDAGPDNVAITRLVFADAPSQSAIPVLVEVSNQGPTDRDVEIELSVDARPVKRTVVHVGARAAAARLESLRPDGRVLTARLTADDALAIDNVRYALIPRDVPVRVSVRSRRHAFIEEALSTNPRVMLIRDETAASYDVIVCDACVSGPGALGVLSIDTRSPVARDAVVTVDQPDHAVLSAIDSGQLIANPTGDPAQRNADVLARASGLPVVLASEQDGARLVQFAFDVDEPATALTVAFPILVANAVEWLGATSGRRELAAGESLIALTRTDEPPKVTGPDGRDRAVIVQARHAIVHDTEMPGVYWLRSNHVEDPFVVNADLEPADVSANLPAIDRSTERVPIETTPLTRALLIAALGALVVEYVIRMRLGYAR